MWIRKRVFPSSYQRLCGSFFKWCVLMLLIDGVNYIMQVQIVLWGFRRLILLVIEMEKRKWLWKRKPSDKSPGETESSGSLSSHSERYSDEQVKGKKGKDVSLVFHVICWYGIIWYQMLENISCCFFFPKISRLIFTCTFDFRLIMVELNIFTWLIIVRVQVLHFSYTCIYTSSDIWKEHELLENTM